MSAETETLIYCGAEPELETAAADFPGRIVFLADASGCALVLDPLRIPLRRGATIEGALGDGEDYELIFALPPPLSEELEAAWPFPETPLSCIGRFTEGAPGAVSGLEHLKWNKLKTGFDHFHEKETV